MEQGQECICDHADICGAICHHREKHGYSRDCTLSSNSCECPTAVCDPINQKDSKKSTNMNVSVFCHEHDEELKIALVNQIPFTNDISIEVEPCKSCTALDSDLELQALLAEAELWTGDKPTEKDIARWRMYVTRHLPMLAMQYSKTQGKKLLTEE